MGKSPEGREGRPNRTDRQEVQIPRQAPSRREILIDNPLWVIGEVRGLVFDFQESFIAMGKLRNDGAPHAPP